jgi:molecular chaperone DnaK
MIIGIDLGTAFSLAAAFDNQGSLVLIPDIYDKTAFYTPSVVHLKGSSCSVGLMALQLLEQTSDANLIRFFKRYLGEDKELYLSPGKNETWYPEGIAALVLKKIINDAEQFLSETIDGAVITVPAHFTDSQRKAVINAAALIDLKIIDLIEEPVAAALHYGIKNKSKNQNILVYDLGGGTFDATLLSITDDSVIVIGKDGISDLGGKEFDEAIANIIHEQFDKALGKPISFTGKKLQQLRALAEGVKIELSMPGVMFVNRTCLIGSDSVEIFITRKEFELAIRSDIEKTGKILKRCLTSAGLDERDVDVMLIVGGSSMIPCIKEYLNQFMPTLADKTKFHEPIKAVAFGAALYGKIMANTGSQIDSSLPKDVKGVTGYNVAVRAINPYSGDVVLDVIIKKNRPLPTHSMKNYFTPENSNGKMKVELVQFIEEDDVKTLGFLNVGPLPSNIGNYQIDVTVNCHTDSTISLKAVDPKSGMELQKTFGKNGMDANYLVKQKALIAKTIVNNVL